jgi:iron complex outermembrane receptor protein
MSLRLSLSLLMTAAHLSAGYAQETGKENNQAVKLPDIQVNGSLLASPLDSMVLRLPAPLQETPRSVSLIGSAEIAERNMKSVNDAFESAPGFFANSRNGGGYHFIARGFRMSPNDTKLDGFAGILAGGGQDAMSLYGIESVTLLGGPANLLYGASSSPGGMINLSSKKPQQGLESTLSLGLMTYGGNGVPAFKRNGRTVELDHNTQLGGVPLRIGLADEATEGYVVGTEDRIRYYGASARVDFGAQRQHTLTPLIHRWETSTPAGGGAVYSPSSSRTTNDGADGINFDDLSGLNVNLSVGGRRDNILFTGFDFSTRPGKDLSLHANYRYVSYEVTTDQWSPVASTLTAAGVISRSQSKSFRESASHNVDLFFSSQLDSAAIKNTLVAGVRLTRTDGLTRNAAGPLSTAQSPVDVRTGLPVGAGLTDLSTGWQADVVSGSSQFNAYLQEQAALLGERLVITGSLNLGRMKKDGAAGSAEIPVTPTVSVMWHFDKQTAAYVSVDKAFAFADPAVNYEDVNGAVFDPGTTSGDSKEVGLKHLFADAKGQLTLAVFTASRENVLQQSNAGVFNANGNRYYFTVPGQEAQGVQLAGDYALAKDWTLMGNFAWTRGSYNNGTPLGDMLAKTPSFAANLTSRWDHGRAWGSEGLRSFFSVAFQEKRLSGNGARTTSAPDPIILPAFFRFDAGLDYHLRKDFKLSLHVRNLFDRLIFVDGTTGGNLQVDAPRTVTLKATYSF